MDISKDKIIELAQASTGIQFYHHGKHEADAKAFAKRLSSDVRKNEFNGAKWYESAVGNVKATGFYTIDTETTEGASNDKA